MKRINIAKISLHYPNDDADFKTELIYREKHEHENHFLQRTYNYVERLKKEKNAQVFCAFYYEILI